MRVTMEDIARMAGVSKATVSRVVNGIEQGVGPETRRRVLQIVKETNYRSYSLPSQNQSKTLGLIIPDIINPFFGELVKAIEGEATEQGYTVLLGNTDFSMEKEERYLSIFLAKRVDGIILVTTAQTAGEHYQRLKKYSVPCVLVDRMLAGAEYTAGIFVDNSYALFMACSLLIQHRNEKIALISGPRNISTSVERIQGYRDALEQYRLPFEERLIKYGDYTFESGYRAIMELEREGTRFTGVLAANDTMALGAIKALKELTYATLLLHPLVFTQSVRFPNRLQLLADYVEQGGALGMMGGYMTFQGIGGKGCYHGSPIEKALPVDFLPYDDRQEHPEGIDLKVDPQRHPALKGLPEEWPYLLGYNKAVAKPGAQVAVEYQGDPILSFYEYGKGRSFAWASDCAPHWMPPAFCEWEYIHLFWKNMIDWVVQR